MNSIEIESMSAHQKEGLLWDYIDGSTTPEMNTTILHLISCNTEWQTKYSELVDMHNLMAQIELEQPPLRFAKNVMEGIAQMKIAPATKKYINVNIIRTIAAFFIIVILGFLIYSVKGINWFESVDVREQIPFENSISGYDLFSSSNINFFIMVNVVLVLMLLDSILTNKKNRFMRSFKN